MKELINKIYLGDTLELMKQIPNESIDLVLSDPPYGVLYRSNHRKEKFEEIENDSGEEFVNLLTNYIAECHRIMKNDTAGYIFCSWHKVDFFKQTLEKHFKIKNLIIWKKNNWTAGDLTCSYACRQELILFFNKGKTHLRGKRLADVLDFDKVNMTTADHPTPKPIPLLNTFIKASSDENDIVFDGFMGSGSTAISCIETNRQFIGAELDPGYHKNLSKRIEKHQKKFQGMDGLIQF